MSKCRVKKHDAELRYYIPSIFCARRDMYVYVSRDCLSDVESGTLNPRRSFYFQIPLGRRVGLLFTANGAILHINTHIHTLTSWTTVTT